MSQHNGTSERELAERIIHMHDDLGMGFRKLAKELLSQGCRINKDAANRLYNKYKAGPYDDEYTSKDLMRLKRARARGLSVLFELFLHA